MPGERGYASQGCYKSKSEVVQVKTRGEIFYRPVISKENTVGEQEGGTPVGWATAYVGLCILEDIKLNNRNDSLKTENAFSPYFTYTLHKFDTDFEC